MKKPKRKGPKDPYTQAGIARQKCYRCKKRRAVHQWQCCADGNIYRPLCLPCDISLNALVLRWVRDPKRKQKLAAYKRKELGNA